jgi:hypothetical protein
MDMGSVSHPGNVYPRKGTVCTKMGFFKEEVQGKVKLSLCSTNYAPRHEGVWGSGCMFVVE